MFTASFDASIILMPDHKKKPLVWETVIIIGQLHHLDKEYEQSVFTISLPRDILGRRLFGEEWLNPELKGKHEDTRHIFIRQIQATTVAYCLRFVYCALCFGIVLP